MTGVCYINQLPNEILVNVFSKIGLTAFSLCRTCRHWNAILSSDHFVSPFVRAIISATIPAGIPDLKAWLKSRVTGDCYESNAFYTSGLKTDGHIMDLKIIGKYLVSTSLGCGSIRIYDLTDMTAPPRILPTCKLESGCPRIYIESYQNLLIKGFDKSGIIKFINLETCEIVDQINTSMTRINYLNICENFLIVAHSNTVKVFDITTKNELFNQKFFSVIERPSVLLLCLPVDTELPSPIHSASISGDYLIVRSKIEGRSQHQLKIIKFNNSANSILDLRCQYNSQVKIDGACLVVGNFERTFSIDVYSLENGQIIEKKKWLKDYESSFSFGEISGDQLDQPGKEFQIFAAIRPRNFTERLSFQAPISVVDKQTKEVFDVLKAKEDLYLRVHTIIVKNNFILGAFSDERYRPSYVRIWNVRTKKLLHELNGYAPYGFLLSYYGKVITSYHDLIKIYDFNLRK